MQVVHLIESRQKNWEALEQLCAKLEGQGARRRAPEDLIRFAALYRAACADLALAESYQLPPDAVQFLHQLVGRAHNQLYQSSKFRFAAWWHELVYVLPPLLFRDNYLRLAFVLFWTVFLTSMYLASAYSLVPEYGEAMLTESGIWQMENMYSQPVDRESMGESIFQGGFYLWHNTGIGLKVFAAGTLFGIGGLFATVFNAAYLGAVFGHMSKTPYWENFAHFVTAHGPFELTAIILSAAAGMRLGFSLVDTGGKSRIVAMRLAAKQAMPTMGAAILLFFAAAFIEGFISPSGALPYEFKVMVSVASSALLIFYFVILGQGKGGRVAAR